MDDENEINECIALEEIPRSDSPASAPSPSADCPSAVTDEADLDTDLLTGEVPDEGESPNIGQESPSIKLPQGLDSSEEEEDSRGERVAKPHANPRIIAVSPQPGDASPDIKSDHDSGVKIDNEDDEDVNRTPDKPARTPSLVSCEAQPSSRSASPASSDRAASAKAPPRKAASQPPRFKNDVEPMEYQRPAPPAGYNRAVHSVQCKAMLIIMATSILAVILIVGFIILNSGNDVQPKTTTSLEGIFNITNRPYLATYADNSSSEYRRLSEEFIYTMNATVQSSEEFYNLYETTTVDGIQRYNGSISGFSRPLLDFTIYLVIPESDVTTQPPEVTGSSLVSDPTSLGNQPTLIDDMIDYLLNVTESGYFGNFTGEMKFKGL
ncbi:uncharacterized protein LOC119724757 [Patiria miniata]|uniref:SEA domain-containing protein n=1 Tax=Patiria miniata TaxID=46514 RepID=A0A913ZJC9_PATMI|nr:uncharacterized protein LOC119724757 [Patiria miniata]